MKIDIKSNTKPWSFCTNRHPTTRGNSWGWIEGAPNITWSNDNEIFNSKAASEVVVTHNQWLEDCRPVELKLIDAKNRLAVLQADWMRKAADSETANLKYRECLVEIKMLECKTPKSDESVEGPSATQCDDILGNQHYNA